MISREERLKRMREYARKNREKIKAVQKVYQENQKKLKKQIKEEIIEKCFRESMGRDRFEEEY